MDSYNAIIDEIYLQASNYGRTILLLIPFVLLEHDFVGLQTNFILFYFNICMIDKKYNEYYAPH